MKPARRNCIRAMKHARVDLASNFALMQPYDAFSEEYLFDSQTHLFDSLAVFNIIDPLVT